MAKGKISHIYWFAYYNLDSPSVRYRAQYPLDYAKKELDISSDLIVPTYSLTGLWRFMKCYFTALFFTKKHALIVIQRVRSNFIYAKLLKFLVMMRKKHTVYDLDDADYLEHKPDSIHFFARKCNCISAGSPEIASYLKQFNTNVLHTSSPIIDLGIVKKERNTVFTIGWIGGFDWGHKGSLYKYLFPAVKALDFHCCLVMIGITKASDRNELIHYFKDCDHVKLIIPTDINWRDEREIQKRITAFDVGIATLSNNPVQLAKSGIKAKQYMISGVPVICNDLAENNTVVIDGYNGFVCNSYTAFSKRLTEIKCMSDIVYWQYAKHARNSMERFSHSKYVMVFENMKNNF